MLVLLRDGCPVPVAVHPRDRLLAWLRAPRLDTALAAGASPDATVALALRAQSLVRARARRSLAHAARRVLAEAAGPSAGHVPVPVCRDRVKDCAPELEDLIRRLLAPGPVSAQGIAQASALLTDATSPLYHRGNRDDLRARVLSAAHALDPA
jgi:hypothetical protein